MLRDETQRAMCAPMPGGRPTKYKPEYVKLAFKFALLGATDKDLAKCFEVDESTIQMWYRRHPEFSSSVIKGRDEADANVAHSLYRRACGFYRDDAVKIFMPANADAPVYASYSEYYPPDSGAAMNWLKNRQGAKWRDRVEHTGSDGAAIQIEIVKFADLPKDPPAE